MLRQRGGKERDKAHPINKAGTGGVAVTGQLRAQPTMTTIMTKKRMMTSKTRTITMRTTTMTKEEGEGKMMRHTTINK